MKKPQFTNRLLKQRLPFIPTLPISIHALLCIAFIFCGVFFISYKAINLFVLSPAQKLLLTNLSQEFDDGYALFAELYPNADWDKVCVVPAYGYMTFDGTKEGKSYIRHRRLYVMLVSPRTSSMFYGLGFAFLRSGKLRKFINIPPSELALFQDGRWFVDNLITIQVPAYKQPDGSSSTVFRFTEMQVNFASRDESCYPRSTAYLQFQNRYQHIIVGG